MDLIGHCAVALLSGQAEEAEIFGPGVVGLMLPNLLHCHDWGYQRLWMLDSVDPAHLSTASLMRTHLVADWIIHYGDRRTHRKRKEGWAYRRMGIASRRARDFFGAARAQDLLRAEATGPDQWSKKRKLDFAHSIVEYALDFILAPGFLSASELGAVCRRLARIDDPGDPGGQRWIHSIAAALGVTSDQPARVVEESIAALAHDAASAREPQAFAVGTTLRKYGFHLDRRSASFVRDFIEGIAAELDAVECRSLCRAIARAAAAPEAIWTGNLGATAPCLAEPLGARS